jgi:hypothetical protein
MKLWAWIIGRVSTPYLIIAGIVIAIAMLSGATYGGWKLRDYQAAQEKLEQAEIANQALQAKVNEVVDLTDRLRKAEHEGAAALILAQDEKERELQNVTDEKDRTINALRLGLLRLRDPGTRPTERAGGAITSDLAGVTPVVQSETGAELSDQLSEFLIGEAARANRTVVELNSCRKIAREQNETCNQLLREVFAMPGSQ